MNRLLKNSVLKTTDYQVRLEDADGDAIDVWSYDTLAEAQAEYDRETPGVDGITAVEIERVIRYHPGRFGESQYKVLRRKET